MLTWNGDALLKGMLEEAAKRLLAAAELVVKTHQQRLGQTGQPSRPGEYPKRVSGRGQASLMVSPDSVPALVAAEKVRMSASTDVRKAWFARWNASTEIAGAVPGGLVADRQTARPSGPYATFKVELARGPDYVSGGEYWDYRRVTVSLYGVGLESVGATVTLLRSIFDSPAPLSFDGAPNVVAHLRTEFVSDSESLEDQPRQGDDIRTGEIVWNVWTHRRGG